jgi:toxin secretion/phage lysis holin
MILYRCNTKLRGEGEMELLENLKFSHEYWIIVLPLVLMVFDIITGYYNAWKNKEVSSSKMRDGLGKKLAEIVYIGAGILVSKAFSIIALEYFISIYVIYMEIISIAENCEKLGIKMPEKIEEKLNNSNGGDK